MTKTEPTERARTVVAAHLLPGERIDVAVRAAIYLPPRPLSMVRHFESFLGVQLGHPRALVLTNRRLLVLKLKAKDRPGDRWYDVQMARDRTRVTTYQERGGIRVMRLESGMGRRRLVLRSRDAERGKALAAALGFQA